MKFSCGCEIDANNLSVETVRLDCPAVYEQLSAGNVKGVFQLESSLCKHWCKEIKPASIDDISSILALVRPGCLKAMSGKKSMTQHFADRKNGKEEVEYPHPILQPILKSTYGILTYQEQAMEIAKAVADFNLQEADSLRKAIGKKLPEEMVKVKKMFLDKAKTAAIVPEDVVEDIFKNIEKSQRYSFNKSHSVAYATLSYWTAYIKTHFPLHFYCACLDMSNFRQDPQREKREIINDARTNDIEVLGPDLRFSTEHFSIDGTSVRFGLMDIKGLGKSVYEKLIHVEKYEVTPKIGVASEWTWYDFLTEMSRKISSTCVSGLIKTGALAYMSVTRTRMLYEYDKWSELTEKEQDWIVGRRPQFNTLMDALLAVRFPKKEGGGAANKNRTAKIDDIIKSLENPPYSLDDKPDRIAFDEEKLLGVAISHSHVDACDTRQANTTCKEFLDGINRDYMILAVSIDKVREIKTKTGENPGQKMAFLSISDATCPVEDCVIFPDSYLEFGSQIIEGNTVLLQVERDKKRGSLIAKKAWSI